MNPWVQSPALHKTSMVAQAYNPSTEEEEVGGRWLHWLSSCRNSNRKTCKAADRFCCGSQGTHLQFALDSVIVEVMWSEYTWSQKVSVQLNSCSPKLATANSLPLAPTSKWSTLVCYRGKLKKLGAFCPPAVGSVTQIHWQTVGTVLQSAPVLISCLWLSCFDLTFPPGCPEGLRWLQPKEQIVPSYLSLQTNKYCIVPFTLDKNPSQQRDSLKYHTQGQVSDTMSEIALGKMESVLFLLLVWLSPEPPVLASASQPWPWVSQYCDNTAQSPCPASVRPAKLFCSSQQVCVAL